MEYVCPMMIGAGRSFSSEVVYSLAAISWNAIYGWRSLSYFQEFEFSVSESYFCPQNVDLSSHIYRCVSFFLAAWRTANCAVLPFDVFSDLLGVTGGSPMTKRNPPTCDMLDMDNSQEGWAYHPYKIQFIVEIAVMQLPHFWPMVNSEFNFSSDCEIMNCTEWKRHGTWTHNPQISV